MLPVTDLAQEINLRDAGLETLPPAIVEQSGLRRLYLDRNRLAALPETIAALGTLEELHLDNNRLAALPAALGRLPSLAC